jgi:hypothetical protein
MPQEMALFGEFNISETLIYFARVFGLTHEKYKGEFCGQSYKTFYGCKLRLFRVAFNLDPKMQNNIHLWTKL